MDRAIKVPKRFNHKVILSHLRQWSATVCFDRHVFAQTEYTADKVKARLHELAAVIEQYEKITWSVSSLDCEIYTHRELLRMLCGACQSRGDLLVLFALQEVHYV